MSALAADAFGKWRTYLWPVHRHELRKILPMLGIFFLITLNYNILHTLKDTLVVHAKGSGAEAIPFVKVWAMLPGAFLLTFLYAHLSSRLTRDHVFYIMISLFIGYFILYICLLYPYRESLAMDQLADYLGTVLPVKCSGFVAMVRNWTAATFYAMAELWSNIVLFLLFWGFANQITQIDEAKRFYGLFGVGANFSGVVAGQLSVFLSRGAYNPSLPFGTTAWEQSLVLLVSVVIVSGLATLVLFYWMQKYILNEARYGASEEKGGKEKERSSFSIRDSFAFLFRSRYVLCLAIVVLCYNLVINLVEVLWKYETKILFPDPNDFNVYMNQVSSAIGVCATLASLFISANSIRCCGWTFTALLTPCILLITSIGFFAFFFLQDLPSASVWLPMSLSPLAMVVFFGSMQNILSRAAKYSVFDATKEMTFIPLDADAKVKSKAVIDGIGCRLGKSGGALFYQILFVLTSSVPGSDALAASAPYVAVVLFIAIPIWIGATYSLGQQFAALTTPPIPRPVSTPAFVPTPLLQEQQAI